MPVCLEAAENVFRGMASTDLLKAYFVAAFLNQIKLVRLHIVETSGEPRWAS